MLSELQRFQFANDGYIVVKNAIDRNHLNELDACANSIWMDHLSTFSHDSFIHKFNFIEDHNSFIQLLKNDRILPIIAKLLGENIYLYHSHLDINLPVTKEEGEKPLTWHRDSSVIEQDLGTYRTPMMSLKVGYWLSDCSQFNRGNMLVLPGSQSFDYRPDLQEFQENAVQVLANRGDAVIFDRRLWHTRSHNVSNITRKALFFGFSYRWLRPRDSFVTIKNNDPLLNYLLGNAESSSDFYQQYNLPSSE